MADDPEPKTYPVCSPDALSSVEFGAHLIPLPDEMEDPRPDHGPDQYYMQELARRTQDRQTRSIIAMTVVMTIAAVCSLWLESRDHLLAPAPSLSAPGASAPVNEDFFRLALALAVPVATNVQAQSRDNPATQAFVDCLLAQAQNGSYTSFDGGKSALQLIGRYKAQWNAFEDGCIAAGDTDSNCTLKSGLLAQSALKQVGK
jgi:hypothetical protein